MTIEIQNYKYANGMLRVKVKDVDDEFVYPSGKFASRDALEREIEKRISQTEKKAKKEKDKKDKLEAELNG